MNVLVYYQTELQLPLAEYVHITHHPATQLMCITCTAVQDGGGGDVVLYICGERVRVEVCGGRLLEVSKVSPHSCLVGFYVGPVRLR